MAELNGLLVSSKLFSGREIKIPLSAAKSYSRPIEDVEAVHGRWILFGTTASDTVYYRNLVRKDTTAEAWIKFQHKKPQTNAVLKAMKVPPAAYTLQYFIVDCAEKRTSVEAVIRYDRKNAAIDTPFSMSSYRRPIVPGSLGEKIWISFCR